MTSQWYNKNVSLTFCDHLSKRIKMKKTLLALFLTGLIPTYTLAQLTEKKSDYYNVKGLNEIFPSGKKYSSQIVLEKIEGFKSRMEIDTAEWGENLNFFWLTNYLQETDGSNQSAKDSSFFTYPEDYIFKDLNNDNTEDMIFQSRGPFVSDSRTFAIFISDSSTNKHNVFWFKGVLSRMSTYTLSLPNYAEKYNGLMVNYVQHGCCEFSGWDNFKTDFMFFTPPPKHIKNPKTMRIINSNTLDY
tara:strand:+ start:111 stop:842 length:732 start_codon:yes stop_codon:yes gene_type:complete